jgi:hypothetical protein
MNYPAASRLSDNIEKSSCVILNLFQNLEFPIRYITEQILKRVQDDNCRTVSKLQGIPSLKLLKAYKFCIILPMNKYLRFGSFLHEKGLVDALDILKARLIQRKNNLRIGELAKAKGWLTEDDILKILIMQEETSEKFGEIAIREKYLAQEQVDTILKEQADSYIFFGEALVKLGVISEEKIIEQLKEFNKIKIQTSD